MMGWEFGGAGIGMMFVFWAVIIFGALWLLANTFTGRGGGVDRAESPHDVLKRRYVNGELDKAEYETMRQDLDR